VQIWDCTNAKEKSYFEKFACLCSMCVQKIAFHLLANIQVTNLFENHFPYMLWATTNMSVQVPCKCCYLPMVSITKWTKWPVWYHFSPILTCLKQITIPWRSTFIKICKRIVLYLHSKIHNNTCGNQSARDIKELCSVNMDAWRKKINVACDIME
jgi:hypothetical protein